MRLSQAKAAVDSRIRALPRLAEGCMAAARKRDAHAMVSYFRSGIAERSFRLAPLRPKTIARKAAAGYPNPEAPLCGLGMEGSYTYVKACRSYRKGRGWGVKVFAMKHHDSKVTTDVLFRVHEYGAVFMSPAGKAWRMPARPAFTKAYAQVMAEARARDDNSRISKACAELLKSGRSQTAAEMKAYADKLEAMNGR